MNIWDETVHRLRESITPYDFNHWIQPIQCERVDRTSRTIVLQVPDSSHGRWLEDNYLAQIHAILSKLEPEGFDVRFMAAGPAPIQATTAPPRPRVSDTAPSGHGLISRYTFDKFVDGPTNQFAATAARACAERPGKQYNPLLIYGGVGLGKTHLLHAVGHEVARARPGARIRYLTSESYVNELIGAIRNDEMHLFRRRYRDECDVLLIDDIQFIAGKDRTQEEFFHMFNTLHASHKQIVMTSDQLPRSIPAMEDRLRSRLEWGLITDIKPPGFETRVAIIKRKADEDGVFLPDDVAMVLARHVSRNVRELEGALLRLAASARIFGTQISIGMAREVLGDLVAGDVRRVGMDAIMKAVAGEFRISVSDLKGPRRHRNITVPRQVAMRLARDLTNASLPQIGQAFGGRDHSTVINALKRIDGLKSADPDLGHRIEKVRRQLMS